MARTSLPIEVNTFVGGLVTEAGPLTFPENASLDEVNFVLNIDGSRNRRLGMDYELGHTDIVTNQSVSSIVPATNHYTWNNAGGDPAKKLLVVQFGNQIKIFDLDIDPVSDGLLYTYSISGSDTEQLLSFTTVDGILVIACGLKNIYQIEYNSPSTFTVTTDILKIRDLFGVEDIINSENLRSGSGVQTRPVTTTDNHTYNLRNQGWAIPRPDGNDETLKDPITAFTTNSVNTSNKYPSNSDEVVKAFYSDANDAGGRTLDRFFPSDLYKNPYGSSHAALGHYIIDAIDRGASRLEEEAKSRNRYPELVNAVTSLPQDRTPGGATIVSEFAGRIWYAGFSGEIIDGDSKSPRMSSYVLFSRTVKDISDITRCYQEGDPTSADTPDIIDTDGGFIRIDGAYGIVGLKNVGRTLMVIASNGVWMVSGGSDYGFSATNYQVTKITDRGCETQKSIVVVDNTVMFWGNDAIYHVATNQFGDWEASNITRSKIQTFYDSIPSNVKLEAQGYYDSYEQKVRWVYYNTLDGDNNTKELIVDVALGVFYVNEIKSFDSGIPKVVGIFQSKPYKVNSTSQDVTVSGVLVEANSNQVQVTLGQIVENNKELMYIAVSDFDTITYSFSKYIVTDFYDWKSVDDVGIDAEAYMVTGYIPQPSDNGKDFQRKKQVPYLTLYLKRTENGFYDAGDGDYTPLNQSSCQFSAMWDWTNSAASNRWNDPREGYRYKRHYFASSLSDNYDTGDSVIVTKNKLRGSGKVVSLKFSSAAGKNLHLYGWSMILEVNGNV